METTMLLLLLLATLSLLTTIVSVSYFFNKEYKIYSKSVKVDLFVLMLSGIALFALSIFGMIFII